MSPKFWMKLQIIANIGYRSLTRDKQTTIWYWYHNIYEDLRLISAFMVTTKNQASSNLGHVPLTNSSF